MAARNPLSLENYSRDVFAKIAHLWTGTNQGIPHKLFLTNGKGDERPFGFIRDLRTWYFICNNQEIMPSKLGDNFSLSPEKPLLGRGERGFQEKEKNCNFIKYPSGSFAVFMRFQTIQVRKSRMSQIQILSVKISGRQEKISLVPPVHPQVFFEKEVIFPEHQYLWFSTQLPD